MPRQRGKTHDIVDVRLSCPLYLNPPSRTCLLCLTNPLPHIRTVNSSLVMTSSDGLAAITKRGPYAYIASLSAR